MSTTPEIYDTVVIGAGLTGALVAHHLAEAAMNVVVLEATESPGGTAGRGTGLALLGTPIPYVSLQARLGTDKGRHVWELTRQNLDLLTGILHKLHQEATHVGSFRVTDDDTEAGLLQESAALLRQDLYAAEIDDAMDYGYIVGLRTADDLAFDPPALIAALLDHANITVEYEAEVQAIRRHADSPSAPPILSVWGHKHYLLTRSVILTNGAHAIRLNRALGSILYPTSMHAVDFRNAGALPTPLVIRQGQVVIQARGNDWRMAGWTGAQQDVLAPLTDIAQQLCPNASVIGRRSWWVAQSTDGFPVVGQLPDMPNVYTVNGLGPWGLSWVCVAVDRLIGLLMHGEEVGWLGIERLLAP
ncbi:MAG TPA: FAD-dependent oxidoreductase [Anaerolineae bacterium]|nr:FAD-dependent oxidoreductase [Anaerolineae bacterium]HQK12326.1 FAD-dependent oxidoreductase [Anaerolineae bacterium]